MPRFSEYMKGRSNNLSRDKGSSSEGEGQDAGRNEGRKRPRADNNGKGKTKAKVVDHRFAKVSCLVEATTNHKMTGPCVVLLYLLWDVASELWDGTSKNERPKAHFSSTMLPL